MRPEQEQSKTETRPAFRALAVLIGVAFLIGAFWDAGVSLDGNGSPGSWGWIVKPGFFLFLAVGFLNAARTGRWLWSRK